MQAHCPRTVRTAPSRTSGRNGQSSIEHIRRRSRTSTSADLKQAIDDRLREGRPLRENEGEEAHEHDASDQLSKPAVERCGLKRQPNGGYADFDSGEDPKQGSRRIHHGGFPTLSGSGDLVLQRCQTDPSCAIAGWNDTTTNATSTAMPLILLSSEIIRSPLDPHLLAARRRYSFVEPKNFSRRSCASCFSESMNQSPVAPKEMIMTTMAMISFVLTIPPSFSRRRMLRARST